MHPFFAGATAYFWNRFSPEQKPEKIGEINPHAPGQSVPPPDTRIDIEDLVLPISRVFLELDFCKPGKTQRRKQLLGGCGDLGFIHRFNISAELTEIPRELARSSRDNGCEGAAVLAKSGVRELRLAPARNNFLNNTISCGQE